MCKTKLLPHLPGQLGVIPIIRHLNGVGDHPIRAAAEHPIARLTAAGKQVRGRGGDLLHVIALDRILYVPSLAAVVTVSNAHRHTAVPCALQRHSAQAVLMHMHDPIVRVCMKKIPQFGPIGSAPGDEAGDPVDFSAHITDLSIVIGLEGAVNQKIKLNPAPVYVA